MIPLKSRSDPVTALPQALKCFTFDTVEKPEALTKNYKTLHDLALCYLCAHSTTHSPPTLTPPATPAPPCPQHTQKERLVIQSCLTLCNPMDSSLPGSSVHGIFQARILEWVCHFLLQRIFPTPRDRTRVSHCRQMLYILATREVHTHPCQGLCSSHSLWPALLFPWISAWLKPSHPSRHCSNLISSMTPTLSTQFKYENPFPKLPHSACPCCC